MAGGVSPGRGVPIGQRPTSSGPGSAEVPGPAVVASPLEVVAATSPHVWVLDEAGAECPGLIVELAQREGVWLTRTPGATWLTAQVLQVLGCGLVGGFGDVADLRGRVGADQDHRREVEDLLVVSADAGLQRG